MHMNHSKENIQLQAADDSKGNDAGRDHPVIPL